MSTAARSHWLIVADSEVIVRNVLSDYLRQCGYKVIDAASTDEVTVILETGSAPISAILSDAELGGTLNPFALRIMVRERWPDIAFILVGNVDAAATAAGELCDEGPHLKRPYDPQAVLQHIRRLLGNARR
jgi:DNA-binding NtrC family response regulator